MSFSKLQLLVASQLDPPCQLLFTWFARFFVVLKQESKTKMKKFVTIDFQKSQLITTKIFLDELKNLSAINH